MERHILDAKMLHTSSKTSAIGSPHVSHLLLRIDYYSNINERCRRFENSSVWIKTQIADVKWCIHYAPWNSLLFHDNKKKNIYLLSMHHCNITRHIFNSIFFLAWSLISKVVTQIINLKIYLYIAVVLEYFVI